MKARRKGFADRRQRLAVDFFALRAPRGRRCGPPGTSSWRRTDCRRRDLLLSGLRALGEEADHGLGGGEIARGQQHEHALAGLLPAMQLLEGGDIVDAGIGARVGREDEAFLEQHSYAVGHSRLLVRSLSVAIVAQFHMTATAHFFGAAAPAAADRHDARGVKAGGHAHIIVGRALAVGGIEADPAEIGHQHLRPGMAGRGAIPAFVAR